MKNGNKWLPRILVIALVLAALLVMLYPLAANYINERYQSSIRADYEESLKVVDHSVRDDAWAAALAYNASLAPIRFDPEGKISVNKTRDEYDKLLNLRGYGIMGYIEIPALDANLPIYHGTEEDVLQEGVGHLFGSSLPVGGDGCHTVLTGHSGVAAKKLFSDLDQLQTGDVFYLKILGETLAYQVIEKNTVLPQETELLEPVPEEDLCTLVTCTPFGVNTHRLLVRGSRIPYEEAEEAEQTIKATQTHVDSTWLQKYLEALTLPCIILAVCILLWIVAMIRRRGHHDKA